MRRAARRGTRIKVCPLPHVDGRPHPPTRSPTLPAPPRSVHPPQRGRSLSRRLPARKACQDTLHVASPVPPRAEPNIRAASQCSDQVRDCQWASPCLIPLRPLSLARCRVHVLALPRLSGHLHQLNEYQSVANCMPFRPPVTELSQKMNASPLGFRHVHSIPLSHPHAGCIACRLLRLLPLAVLLLPRCKTSCSHKSGWIVTQNKHG